LLYRFYELQAALIFVNKLYMAFNHPQNKLTIMNSLSHLNLLQLLNYMNLIFIKQD